MQVRLLSWAPVKKIFQMLLEDFFYFCSLIIENSISTIFVFLVLNYYPMVKYKVFIVSLLVTISFSLSAQTVIHTKDKWGEKLFYVSQGTMYQKDKWGTKLYYYDGQTIYQKDKWGVKLYYMDGNTVRIKDKWGEKLYYFDGNAIKMKDKWGTQLYYIDGNVLKQKDKWGSPIYYFEGEVQWWMIVCII